MLHQIREKIKKIFLLIKGEGAVFFNITKEQNKTVEMFHILKGYSGMVIKCNFCTVLEGNKGYNDIMRTLGKNAVGMIT